uniref:Photosystem I assembly protein Ycf4 n=3 Tax=Gnetum TaxID=3380 RepID=R4L5N3_9SPER|nr:photosystem I assembly protein Ycf4 [Gnetum montanum]ANZ53696.1 photosystem I assembly protein ycf4 [Gnetum parvifolium]ANZ54158.1 photosystem I assembly protein ycf4 [Gnetum pendulum]AGL11050.1 photosystem I assembly protein Ycf4 [Gnetum montanum]ANZ53762.1 photosystem I assembly protein ycf4 [Gnetum parvifolium]ANZ53828.1 photosystem I assembly protein ycf4 [Gnetum parvifolium]
MISMNHQAKRLWIEPIKGSRRKSNFFFASIILGGALGFLLVGFSSYIGRNLVPPLLSHQILFVPQGIVMCFYGIAGLFFSSYLWCTILFNVGGGYNKIDEKKGILCFFRWGFPGKNRRVFLRVPLKNVQTIKMEVQESLFYSRHVLYMKVKGLPDIPLARTGDHFNLSEMEQKAAELAHFLRVSIEGF